MSQKHKEPEAEQRERKLICSNKKARYNYFIDETYEAGLALTGTEVKALREGRGNLSDAFARPRGSELFLYNAHISPYGQARDNHEPERPRKLLLKRREIDKLSMRLRERGFTLVPLELYFSGSYVKAKLGLARGKKAYDKRQSIAKRESEQRIRRVMKRHTRRGGS